VERIEGAIFVLREHRVLLDEHLALLDEVDIKMLNQVMKRHLERFPSDFMFQLAAEEAWISMVTGCDHKDRSRPAHLSDGFTGRTGCLS